MPRPSPRKRAAGLLLLVATIAVGRIAYSAEAPRVPLLVVWPPDGVTVSGDQVRVGGRTDPAAKLTVDGHELRVYPSGAFAGTARLKAGANTITYRASLSGRTATATRTVRRTPPLETLPESPIQFDPAFEGEPAHDMEIQTGDTIRVRVKGSPGAKATFRIGDGPTHYPMVAAERSGIGGFYEGVYQVQPADRFVQARVTSYLGPRDKGRRSARRQLMPARITVRADPFPDPVRLAEDYGRLRAEPWNGAPLADAPRGTFLNIDGRVGDRLRVRLTPSLHGWLRSSQIEPARGEAPLERGDVRNLTVEEEEDQTVLRVPLGLRVPFTITPRLEPPTLELTWFGVDNRLNWITDRSGQGAIDTVCGVPAEDGTCRLRVALRGPVFGYQGYYEDTTFCLAVRPPPPAPSDPARPLAGCTIVLDPGHGGDSHGTVGSTGLEEKAVNLELCEILRRHLERRGAHVRMTRSTDVDVSLADRCRFAEEGGDLFVSLHNNSISLTGDPLAARGVGLYYYHPHARDAAQALYRRLLRVEPPPEPYGVVMADFFVCREITSMPSVLVECLFLSHPEDEILLLDKAFCERNMQAVATGIADWRQRAGPKAGAP